MPKELQYRSGRGEVLAVVNRTIRLSAELNASTAVDQVRERLSYIIGTPLDESVTVFPAFYINFGRFIQIGKNLFINPTCSFLDMGVLPLKMMY